MPKGGILNLEVESASGTRAEVISRVNDKIFACRWRPKQWSHLANLLEKH